LCLYNDKYYDSNFCHLTELLSENDGISLSSASVRRILKSAGHESKRERRLATKKHRSRERRAQAEML
jgi:transposase